MQRCWPGVELLARFTALDDPDAIFKVPVIAALPKAAIPTVFVNELFDPAEPVFGQHFSGSSQNELNGGSQFLERVVCGIPFDDSYQFQCQLHALVACTWLMRHLNPPMLASGSK
jgi:hypothetical protein